MAEKPVFVTEYHLAVMRDVIARVMVINFKKGKSDYPPGKWISIAGEEFGEICQSLQADESWAKDTDKSNTYDEIIDLAAVCLRWAEQIKRNEKPIDKNLN